jgi:putative ABC transport system permease protein
MFTNYIIIALRSMRHNKGATIISIAGLSIGVSCALLIFLYIQHELSRDNFHTNRYDIYRVLIKGQPNADNQPAAYQAAIAHDFIPKMIKTFPQGKQAARLSPQTVILNQNGRKIQEDNFFFTEPSLFDIFDFKAQDTDARTALSADNSVLISKKMAQKYFKDRDPVGSKIAVTVFHQKTLFLTVTGILKKIPPNSSLQIDFLAAVPFEELKKMLPDWMPLYTYSFIKFDWIRTTEIIGLDGYKYWVRTPTLVTMVDEFKKQLLRFKLPDIFSDNYFNSWHFTVEPLKPSLLDTPRPFISPTPEFNRPVENRSSLLVLFLFGTGILILAVSCINVINLSVARSTGRAREIAVRKVMGADQWQLMLQFLTESLLLSIISLILAASLVELVLPAFNKMVHKELAVDYMRNGGYLSAMALVVILTGFLSGLYPAVFLASFQPVDTLKGEPLLFSRKVRKILTIFQITVCVSICITTLLFAKETRRLYQKPLGFNKDRIVFFKLDDPDLEKHYNRLKQELLALPDVQKVTSSGLAAWKYGTPAVRMFTCLQTGVSAQAMVIPVDPDYLDVYQIPIVSGNGFGKAYEPGTFCIINSAAQNIFKLDHVSEKKCLVESGTMREITGVSEDFYYLYPFKAILPLVLVPATELYGIRRSYISVKLGPENHTAAIQQIKEKVEQFFPKILFDYKWVNLEIDQMHRQKNDAWNNVLTFSAWISGFLATLGLFGFSGYEMDRRTKEIGIRKALGANRLEISGLFILRFLRLTLVANLIAWPVSYLSISWLLAAIHYPYQIDANYSVFISVTLLTLFIAFFTVSFQTFRAASLDPQNALRDQ